MALRRASYRRACDWIASEDEPTLRDPAAVSAMISVLLVADLFGITAEVVAKDVIKRRVVIQEQERQDARAKTANRIDGFDRDEDRGEL